MMIIKVHFVNHIVINKINLLHKKGSRFEILSYHSHFIESFLFSFMHSTRYRFISV